jgi:Cu/Ag efflux pump CusA
MSVLRLGVAGRMAAVFMHSKLTPLLMLASLLLGVWAVIALPREEEPQIIVPMVDVFVEMPGVSPAEIEQRVTRPLEKLLWEVPGVEYIYSTSSAGRAIVIHWSASPRSWQRTPRRCRPVHRSRWCRPAPWTTCR